MKSKKEQNKKIAHKQERKVIHRQFEGEIVSEVENKTVHALVRSIKMHPKYKKQYTTSKKYAIHDEKNEAKLGDKIVFEECRPFSKTKKWRLIKVIN